MDVSDRRDPRTLTTLSDILSCLSVLQSEETEHTNSLAQLLNAREPIQLSLNRLNSLIPHVDGLQREASLLSEQVSRTAKTANRVGDRVRSLDEEMRRVREAGDRVGQVMELKSSLADLQSSIDSLDWESAARHCARAMSLPSAVTSGRFAEIAVPTSENHLPPAQTLQLAREKLLSIFRHNFEQASRSRDSTATTRFFKLFPSIGWENEGLDAYASFVVDLVRVRAPLTAKTSSALYYVTALTALFEGIAIIVDQHQPVVEKYYGPGRMRRVIQTLLQECDRVSQGIVEGWEEERSMKRKLLDIMNNPPMPMHSLTNRRPPSLEEAVVDPREIDRVLSELTGMVGRWSLFRKFLAEYLNDDSNNVGALNTSESTGYSSRRNMIYIDSTESFQLFERLIGTYGIPLEVWYIRTSIDKAHRLSETDFSQTPPLTTTPDDVFYILKIVISRILSTGSLSGVERIFEQLRVVMERDYIGVIQKKLDDISRSTGTPNSTSREKEHRLAFMSMVNDLDISSSHLERLVRDLSGSQTITQYFIEEQQPLVKGQLSTFSTVIAKLRSVVRTGVEQIFNQLLRPKLRTLISDVYRDVSYLLDDDSYLVAEYQDVVRKRFVKAWENLLDGYQDAFTDSNYRLFFGLALEVLLRPWEKLMMTHKFTELGAVSFDRDLRSITTYLTSQTAFADAREKFGRLQQMSTLLNLDSEEDVDSFYGSSGITWKLTIAEARTIAGLKI